MTPPIPPQIAGREASVHRLITPTVQIFTAAVILFTGAGIAAVFWKMPTSTEMYDLYHVETVDKDLAAVPLPNESVAAISPEEMKQISLPSLDIAPVTDIGAEKYAQVYEAPASLAAVHTEKDKVLDVTKDESFTSSAIPQKFEPMRHIVEKKPIAVETVNDEFLPKPASVSTTEKSDELLSTFQFAENGKADFANTKEPLPPTDPFPVISTTAEQEPATPMIASQLQPLKPLSSGGLDPLLPLQRSE